MADSEKFNKAHIFVQKWEGGISDHPADKGGYTAYGVCTAFMRDFMAKPANRVWAGSELGLEIPKGGCVDRAFMRKITKDMAARIFKRAFWDALDLDSHSLKTAVCVYDCAVNSGSGRSVRLLQQAHNNLKSKTAAALVVDGLIGPKTHAAIKALAASRETELVNELIRLRELFLRNIVKSNPSQSVFLKGWLNRTADLRKYVSGLSS